jgi:RecA/RadA recombinase
MPRRKSKKKTEDSLSDLVDVPISGTKPLDCMACDSWSDRYIDAAGDIEGWSPAVDVLDNVVSVRTVFPDFNRAVRVGGLPVKRIHTIHGPSAGGKTAFVLGLVRSFVDVGYLGGYIDAEFALGREFASEIVSGLSKKKNFLAVRPSSYEETIERVDSFLKIAEQIKQSLPDSKSILVVDSINKLVPKRELRKMLKGGSISKQGAEELTKAHHGRYRAALNQAWLDHLTPKLCRSDTALVIIAQEREGEDSTNFFIDSFSVKGGAALLFDASLVIRIMKASPIWLSSADDKKNENITGFAHRVRIWKSKVGHMEGRHSDCIFHLSNGRITPSGLDMWRDTVIVGLKFGVVVQGGAWYSYGDVRVQGLNNFILKLSQDTELFNKLFLDVSIKIDELEGRIDV